MSKAKLTLEFDMSDSDERRNLILTTQATQLASAIFTMDESIRNRVKYTSLSGDAQQELDWVRSLIRDELGDLTETVLG